MSVVGIDLGCDFSKVAVAHRKKIQIVPNELTKLITPSLTAFSEKERSFGDAALTQFTRNYKNTISQLKRWLGGRADDTKLQEDAAFWLPGIQTGALPDGRFGLNVNTSQGKLVLAPEQILSGFLGQLKKFTTTFLEGLKVTDCVIACPSYFDDAQRRALLNAAKLAELKVLRLLEEPTAIALNYGILRNLPENETQRVVFVDVGYASTQVAVVDFVRGKLSVRYKAANPFVGGRDFDRAIYETFRAQWLAKYKVDINEKPKQKLKLIQSCKKIKKLLTGNKDAVWTLDCFHDDNDFPLKLTREEMETSCDEQQVFAKLLAPLQEALEATKDDNVKIHSCEIVGGVSRVPCIQQRILAELQKFSPTITALSTTLNGDEACARGCALMCAMLSPNFRVKDFQVQDILTWPITISYPSEKAEDKDNIEQLIMQRGNPQPCTAKVMFNKTQNFVFSLQHPEEYKTKEASVSVEYPFKTNLNIGEFNVQLVPLSEKAVQPPKVKLLLDINKQGLLDWPKASLIEYVKREPEPEPAKETKPAADDKAKEADAEMADKAKDGDDKEKSADGKTEASTETATTDNDVEMEDTAKEAADAKEKEKETSMDVDADEDTAVTDKDKKAKKKDKRKVTRSLLITGNFFNELKADEFNKMFALEANLINVDRIVLETDEAKNDLETYMYALRDKIDDTHREFIEEKEREKLSAQLTELEDWLYEQGDEANKTQFLERQKQLKDIGDPMEYKKWESEHRQGRVTNFKKLVAKYQQWVTNEEEKYAHIGVDKRKEVKKFANDADAWLANLLIQQDRLKKYEAPKLKCKDIDNKYRELYGNCDKILNIPKPKPKVEEKKKEEEAKKEESGDGKGDAAKGDAEKKDSESKMEVDGGDVEAQAGTGKEEAADKEKEVGGDAEMADKTSEE